MHADGYAGFEGVCRDGRITEVACMAHIRRKFFDVHASQGTAVAAEALERIAQLYAIEDAVRGRPPDIRAAKRQAEAAPILDDLRRWLETQLTKISGKTPLAAAIRYALTRMKRLTPWLEARLPGARQQRRRKIDPRCRRRAEELPFYGLGARRKISGDRLHPYRDRQAEPRRPAGVAHRRAGPHRRSQDHSPRRIGTLAIRSLSVSLSVGRRQTVLTGRFPSHPGCAKIDSEISADTLSIMWGGG